MQPDFKGTPDARLKAVALVGGQGTRLQPLTFRLPKCMVPVLNKPLMEHTIAYLGSYGIKDIILAVSYRPEDIQSHFGDGRTWDVNLHYTMEPTPLGTAGAVKNAGTYLDTSFVVLNGDIFADIDIAGMLAFHRQKGAKATIALRWVDNPSAFGIVETDDNKRVKRFIEKPTPDRITTNWINAGIYILEPEVLRYVPDKQHYMFENGLFPSLLEKGEPVYGYPFESYWLDMGTPAKYLRLNCDLLESKAITPLLRLGQDGTTRDPGVTVHPTAKINGPAAIGARCHIGRGAKIKGPVVIGPGCTISEGAAIERAVLWEGVTVGAGASIKNCVIGNDCNIAENSRISDSVVAAGDPAGASPVIRNI